MPDRLVEYARVLGRHAGALEEQVEALVAASGERARDPLWRRMQRAATGHPFAALDRIVRKAVERQVEYAAQRVAVSVVVRERASGSREQAGELAEELLRGYEDDLGHQRARQIRVEAKRWYPFVSAQGPGWLEARRRELADRYTARGSLDRAVSGWMADYGDQAARAVALDRIETMPEREEPTTEVPFQALLGSEIERRVEERADEFLAGLAELSRAELQARRDHFEAERSERHGRLLQDAKELESQRVEVLVPRDEELASAVEAEDRARGLTDRGPAERRQRRALESTARYLRYQVREGRAATADVERSIAELRERWTDFHGQDAGLQRAIERCDDRSIEAIER